MFADRNDWDALAARYGEDGRLRIEGALPPDTAKAMHETIANIPYALMVALQGQGRVLNPADLSALSDAQHAQLQQEIFAGAARGEGFVYEGHQIAGSPNEKLKDILARLNEPKTVERIRQLTGHEDITHADGQATRYRAGHFLTRHTDDPHDQQRRVAYVLSLTPQWHPDWGGLLQFYERNGTPRDAWSPGFNILSLFDVHHVHAVTYVAPFAPAPRLSVTGWFRAGDPA